MTTKQLQEKFEKKLGWSPRKHWENDGYAGSYEQNALAWFIAGYRAAQRERRKK